MPEPIAHPNPFGKAEIRFRILNQKLRLADIIPSEGKRGWALQWSSVRLELDWTEGEIFAFRRNGLSRSIYIFMSDGTGYWINAQGCQFPLTWT